MDGGFDERLRQGLEAARHERTAAANAAAQQREADRRRIAKRAEDERVAVGQLVQEAREASTAIQQQAGRYVVAPRRLIGKAPLPVLSSVASALPQTFLLAQVQGRPGWIIRGGFGCFFVPLQGDVQATWPWIKHSGHISTREYVGLDEFAEVGYNEWTATGISPGSGQRYSRPMAWSASAALQALVEEILAYLVAIATGV
jgi:hypothetical protein